MVSENWDLIAEDLEKQELLAQGGASAQLYAKLLAIYLYQNDLCNAKFLWKRIPCKFTTPNSELANIWNIGKAMWFRDPVEIFKSLNNVQWTDNVSSLIKDLKDKIQEKGLRLISHAYSSINAETMAYLLGVTPAEAINIAKQRDWTIEGNLVMPELINTPSPPVTSTEDQLHKLTSFVSFLEN